MNQLGWFAMVLIHTSSLPSVISNLVGASESLPPLSLVSMVWIGLLVLFAKACHDGDRLYTYGNGVGLFINTLTLACVIAA